MHTEVEEAIKVAREMRAHLTPLIERMAQRDSSFQERYRRSILSSVLEEAMKETRAEMGNIQLFDPSAAALRIEVHHGCSKSFLAFFDCVHVGEAACGAAFQTGSQVTVEDVADSPVFAGRTLELMLDSGVRAVQSIPLVGPSGCIVGILSTHWPRPWRLSNRDFLVLNMLACRTAGWVEERIYCCPHPV